MIDERVAFAMGKLLKRSVPIKILKHKFDILTMQEEVKRLEGAKKIRIRHNIIPFLNRADNAPISSRIDQLKQSIASLSQVFIEGDLTPLTEGELWECRHHYTATRIQLRRSQPQKEMSSAESQAWDDSLDFCSNAVLLAKEVECALKRRDGESLVRVLTYEETSKIDPRILAEIWLIYNRELMLTDDELKKSSAPRAMSN